MRAQVLRFVDDARFQRFIIAVIVVNAITLGAETSARLTASYGDLLYLLDRAALSVFVVELVLRLYAHRLRFFRDPWSVFDFVIVAIALVPASGPFAVLRALRILRVLRLVSAVPSMRRVIGTLLSAIPGLMSIGALLGLVVYIAGVMGTKLFGESTPEYFGTLGRSLFTLFQIMTLDNWERIARDVMVEQPLAWVFFVVYLLASSFTALNLFIAVVVNAMERHSHDEHAAEAVEAAAKGVSNEALLAELRALRTEVAQLRTSSADLPPPR